MKKKYIHLFVSIVIILVCIYYVLNNVSLSELRDKLLSVKYMYLLPAVFLVMLTFLFRAMRWRYLINSVKVVKTYNLISPLMVGFMSNILPARAGEFIRAYLLSKKEGINFSASFATIFIERLFDMAIVLILLLWILLFNTEVFRPGESEATRQLISYMTKFGWISFFGSLFIFTFSILLQYKNELAMKIVHICIKPLPDKWGFRIVSIVQSFTQGLSILKDKRGLLMSIFLSLLVWASIVFAYYPLFYAFGIENDLPFPQSMILMTLAISIFITLVPTPAFLGSFHAACVAVLYEVFGIPKAVALSYGIVAWIVTMGFTILVGMIFVMKDQISFKELTAKIEEVK